MRSFCIVGYCWILDRQLSFLNNSASLPRREMACYTEPVSLLPVWDTEMTSGGMAALSSRWSLRSKASCFKVAELRDRGVCIPGDSSSSRLAPRLQLCPLLVGADILEASIGCVWDYSQIHSLEHQGENVPFSMPYFAHRAFLVKMPGRDQVGPQTKLQNGIWNLRS